MKKSILALGFIVLVSFLTMGLKSCTSKESLVSGPHSDTISVVARQQQGNALFVDSAIRTIAKVRKFKDSSSLDGVESIDTSFRLMQLVDTLRDNLHHPLFDADHKPRWRYLYSPTSVPDSLNKYIKVVDIPMWPVK